MAERLKAPLSKSGILAQTGIVGSNPTLSATCRMLGPEQLNFRLCKRPAYRNSIQSSPISLNNGEMSELAEGARLEIVCTVKNGTEGSNPSLSAMLF